MAATIGTRATKATVAPAAMVAEVVLLFTWFPLGGDASALGGDEGLDQSRFLHPGATLHDSGSELKRARLRGFRLRPEYVPGA